jgi:hypothetical protein
MNQIVPDDAPGFHILGTEMGNDCAIKRWRSSAIVDDCDAFIHGGGSPTFRKFAAFFRPFRARRGLGFVTQGGDPWVATRPGMRWALVLSTATIAVTVVLWVTTR